MNNEEEVHLAYGPVPSRRLGSSLGINNIPAKNCTYSCVYCQVGRNLTMRTKRRFFFSPQDIYNQVLSRIENARERGLSIDYLTFVPDGEPTLDQNLGETITLLRPLGIPIGVISNASLIWRVDVRDALEKADWVSLKIDAVSEDVWRRIDRPHRALFLSAILEEIVSFSKSFSGKLVTETMLIRDVNDGADSIKAVGDFLKTVKPHTAYIGIPTRPPVEKWVRTPDEKTILKAYDIFGRQVSRVEYLIGYEGNAFASTGNIKEDLMSITAVHPLREDAVEALLSKTGDNWESVRSLLDRNLLTETEYGGHKFYLRKFFPTDR